MFSDSAIKYLTFLGPFLASTLAITYDVGFFYGSDISFFTFFSFTEHLVFALQTAPFAILASGCIWGIFYGGILGFQQSRETMAKFEKSDIDEQRIIAAKITKPHAIYLKARPWIIGLFLFGACTSLFTRHFNQAIASAFTAWFAYTCVNFWERVQTIPSERTKFAGVIVGTTLLLAFSYGYDRAQAIVTSASPTENIFTDEKPTPVRLIRSGEKGVLFYSIESKKIIFIRWDAIKNIQTI